MLQILRGILLISLILSFSVLTVSQTTKPEDPLESDFELLTKAEAELRLCGHDFRDIDHAKNADRLLKTILRRNPETPFRSQALNSLRQVDEILGRHNLAIANFYKDVRQTFRGAESLLKQILTEHSNFSRMDEVLLKLAELSLINENEEDARYYASRLICEHPSSSLVEGAFSRLNNIGWASWEGCEVLKSKPLPTSKPK